MIPKIVCHIMSSVDGRLLPGRWTQPYDGTSSSILFKDYAEIGKTLGTDAWMFGKTTTKEVFPYKFMPKSNETAAPGKIYVGHRNSSRLFLTVDPDADIFYTDSLLRGDNILTILGTNATVDYLQLLEDKGISYIVLNDPMNLREAMEIIHESFGINKISLQGGGIIDGAMLAAGLLDELSLVIYPGIDGLTTSPSIFEYLGADDERPANGQALELLSAETRSHGIVWLRYKFHKKQ